MQKIRYGIVGLGGYGSKRRELLRRSGVYEIVGGVDIREDAFVAAEAVEGRPLKRYASVEALAADPAIEAVFIATPAQVHVEQALVAARAGKAVFVEKPLGNDLVSCRDLVAYCERNHIPHGHGFSARFFPLWQYVKTFVEHGQLGRIVSVSAATMSTAGLAFPPDNWRFRAGMNPGGPLFQCGIHKLDLLRFLFGEGHWLAGTVHRTITASPTDDSYVLLGRFDGFPVTFHGHYVASYRHMMEIYGTTGGLYISEHPDRLEHKTTDLTTGREECQDITAQIPPSDAESESLRDFALAVRERRQPRMNGREGLKSLELVFAAADMAKEIK